jgi:selenocysteine lyase/cysteine desulfurase
MLSGNARARRAPRPRQMTPTKTSRRALLRAAALLPVAGIDARRAVASVAAPAAATEPSSQPGALSRADFALGDQTYLDAAAVHPLSTHAAAAMRAYLDRRAGMRHRLEGDTDPRALFAQLINARPEEVAVVTSTSVGENYVVNGLGLRGSRDRVVTDSLHFMGSLYMYDELARSGLDVQVVRPRADHAIHLDDVAAKIDSRTRLVAVSLVSMTTGFKHDLKALCELAHSHGALVYADAVQAIGNIPVDVRDSGIDFLAASTYKWLMGDFGAGFMYVRADRLGALGRPVYGYEQLDFEMTKLPYDPQPGASGPMKQLQDAHGHLEIGSEAEGILVAAVDSMQRILAMGVDEIARRRQPLVDFLRAKLPPLGFEPLAPPSNAALICFGYPDADRRLRAKLNQANVRISIYTHRIRVAPSVYNDIRDMEKLVEVLAS